MARRNSFIIILLVISFFLVSSAVDFLHNHRTIKEPANCPAGQFLSVYFSTGIFQIVILFFFILIKILSSIFEYKYKKPFIYHWPSRSPPLSIAE